MRKIRYVIDTNAVISLFNEVFNGDISLSVRGINIIRQAFNDKNILILIPSIVFLEIFSKWFKDEETTSKIRYQVYEHIKNQENFSIELFDKEVLENFIAINDIEAGYNFDNHDKQVFATAMKFNCPLITSDLRLIRYNERKNIIPSVIS